MKKRKFNQSLNLNKAVISNLRGGNSIDPGFPGPGELSRLNDDMSQCLCGNTNGNTCGDHWTCGASCEQYNCDSFEPHSCEAFPRGGCLK